MGFDGGWEIKERKTEQDSELNEALEKVEKRIALKKEAQEKLEESVEYSGETEVHIFFSWYAPNSGITINGETVDENSDNITKIDFIKKVQKDLGFVGKNIDGVIGPNTLKKLYMETYVWLNDKPLEVQEKLAILYNVKETNSEVYNEKIENSISSVGRNEVHYFFSWYAPISGITIDGKIVDEYSNSEIKVRFIKKVQENLGFTGKNADGVIGTNTLKKLYSEYAWLDNKPFEVEQRIKISNEIGPEKYKHFYRNSQVKPILGRFNIFNKNTYFGGHNQNIEDYENFRGEYIAKGIKKYIENGEISEEINQNINLIKFKKLGGKSILLFYVNGTLEVACYVSPGTSRNRTPTKYNYIKGNRELSKYHISSSYPEENGGGAIMPYAVNVQNSIRIHGSDSMIDGYGHSHGCIRVGLFYAEKIFSKVKELGRENVYIDTSKIY